MPFDPNRALRDFSASQTAKTDAARTALTGQATELNKFLAAQIQAQNEIGLQNIKGEQDLASRREFGHQARLTNVPLTAAHGARTTAEIGGRANVANISALGGIHAAATRLGVANPGAASGGVNMTQLQSFLDTSNRKRLAESLKSTRGAGFAAPRPLLGALNESPLNLETLTAEGAPLVHTRTPAENVSMNRLRAAEVGAAETKTEARKIAAIRYITPDGKVGQPVGTIAQVTDEAKTVTKETAKGRRASDALLRRDQEGASAHDQILAGMSPTAQVNFNKLIDEGWEVDETNPFGQEYSDGSVEFNMLRRSKTPNVADETVVKRFMPTMKFEIIR
jgi:hypothetical protein